MSAEHDKNPSGFRSMTCYTNDALIPLYDGGSICDGFHSIPMPPADPARRIGRYSAVPTPPRAGTASAEISGRPRASALPGE
jgi:hypothetical protein